jgi:hypothetical protein
MVPVRMSTKEEMTNEMGDGNIAPSSASTRRYCRQRHELPFTTGAAIPVDGGMHIHQY